MAELNARSGVCSAPVCRSTRTACRWPNVPRRVSWPTSRTGCPSISTDPNASSSPVAQSMAFCSTMAARRASSGCSRGCGVNPSGRLSWVSTICLMASSEIAVGVSGCTIGNWAVVAGRTTAPGSIGRLAASRVSVKARSRCCW